MRSRNFQSDSSLRFRRWSRKGYAMFVSVTNVVTIGVLSSDICEKSEAKLSALSVSSNASIKSESSDLTEDLDFAFANKEEILLVAEKQTADVYACINFIINN